MTRGHAARPIDLAFATGIECSYPMAAGPGGRLERVDELERTFHYRRWRDDLRLVCDLGLTFLRYGPPYYRIHVGPGRYDWSFADDVFGEMRRLGIVPIADLCHFGVPDWVGGFDNPDWPALFAEYAGAFAERYPWVTLHTPVNEIFVCAKFSGLYGMWNERRKDERGFVTAVKHPVRANLLATASILRVQPRAVIVQSESAEYVHTGCSGEEADRQAAFENERRFLSLDLLLSRPVSPEMRAYLADHGLADDEYDWFMRHGLGGRIVVGVDYYARNEQLLLHGGAIRGATDVLGWYAIARQYYERYRRPLMHTETNNVADGGSAAAERWLWKEFLNVKHMRSQGLPVLGFTWYSLTDQVDWHSALQGGHRIVNPIGLVDLRRRPRPVGRAYAALVREFEGGVRDVAHFEAAVAAGCSPVGS